MLAPLLVLAQPRQISFSVFRSGDLTTFEGELGDERKVHAVLANGDEVYFDGERLAERKVVSVLRSGEVQKFQGARGVERKVRAVLPDGKALFFEGEAGSEREVPSPRECEKHEREHEHEHERASVEATSENGAALLALGVAVTALAALGRVATRGVVFAAESLVGMMVTQYVLLLAAWVLIGGSVLRLVVLALLVTAAATVFASLPTESVRPRARK